MAFITYYEEKLALKLSEGTASQHYDLSLYFTAHNPTDIVEFMLKSSYSLVSIEEEVLVPFHTIA